VKTYQDAVKSLKELQESAIQWNDSDMLSVISQAKVFVSGHGCLVFVYVRFSVFVNR
jgi:hypothetical protein